MGQKRVNDESLTQKTILKDSRNMTVTLILAGKIRANLRREYFF